MKSNTRSYFTSLLILILGLGLGTPVLASTPTNETTIKEINQQTKELLESLKKYTAEQRDEAMGKIKLALDKLDKRIEALETDIVNKWDVMDQVAREKAHASLRALHHQRTVVAEWYGSMKNSSVGAWGHMKQGFSSAYEALHDAWSKAEKEYTVDK